ncbi:prenyltransferase [Corynebacterium renale]|uniref:4-hydroxybenzoate polyprenyltransferase n=1 Tax=Corynebacterium renale TaxID=1724 RepID=A0A2A9DNI7_9CORY|nr:prenyltransferase [Corynebacterium renale]PFG27926.1 4-hydroxybenzoate polyprenyltransferase [Corynebacterium renale]SQG63354.1 prenyltransferase [Corynebacterium renale]SQI21768.1 prenyltransferase [Corynebacterium renale]STC99696.1 prenyltransferase [Corynebacterium renale]
MELLRVVLASSRPISWVNTAFPFAAAYLFAGGGITWQLVVGTIFFLIPYNIAIYGINDVFDYESDMRNPRKGGLEGSVLHPKWHKPVLWASVLTTVPFIVALLVGGTWASALWLVVSMFTVVAYSAKGLRFKEKPVLDSVTSSAHFATPALVGTAMVGPAVTTPFWVAIGAFFLWGMASHALGAVQDIHADRQGGLSSIATELGARFTTRAVTVTYLVAAGLLFTLPSPGWVVAVAGLGYALNAARFWNIDDAHAEDTRRAWKVFLVLNYVVGFIVTMALLWAVAPA